MDDWFKQIHFLPILCRWWCVLHPHFYSNSHSSNSQKQLIPLSLIPYLFLCSIPPSFSFQHTSTLRVPVIYGSVCAAIEDTPLQVSLLPPLPLSPLPSLHACSQSLHTLGLLGRLVPQHTFFFLHLSLLSFSVSLPFSLSLSAENSLPHNWVILSPPCSKCQQPVREARLG